MTRYRITARACRDLDAIYDYIVRHNLSAARTVIEGLIAAIERLAEMPGMGRARTELREALHSLPVEAHPIPTALFGTASR